MNRTTESLYELLPELYRRKDAQNNYVLKALIGVIGEQARVIEEDIANLYENWFIETADDWVVPYIGDLVGWRQVHEAGQPVDPVEQRDRLLNKILIPRREVANTVRYRRCKGTLALLEMLARDVADWPAHAVEFFRLTAILQAVNHVMLDRGNTVNCHDTELLERLSGARPTENRHTYEPGAFDEIAHTVDVRRISSALTPGRQNPHNIGLFVWRLKPFRVTRSDAYPVSNEGDDYVGRFTFEVTGRDQQLFNRPTDEESMHDLSTPINVPERIRREAFKQNLSEYYGPGKSLHLFEQVGKGYRPVAIERIVPANLTDWMYTPSLIDEVAIDPVLGRIKFPDPAGAKDPQAYAPPQSALVTYHHGFSSNIGGGEYRRVISEPADATIYRVSRKAAAPGEKEFTSLGQALDSWRKNPNKPRRTVIEIEDSGRADVGDYYDDLTGEVSRNYVRLPKIEIPDGYYLQIRAANCKRPVVFLDDSESDTGDHAFQITLGRHCEFLIDGLLFTRGKLVLKSADPSHDSGSKVSIRHCTLVPRSSPSIVVHGLSAAVEIETSITGAIKIGKEESRTDPISLSIRQCVVDAHHDCTPAISGDKASAHATLDIACTTVIGKLLVHAVSLAENSIFLGHVLAERRQSGCVRFCYVPQGSTTPKRYRCQPDLALAADQSPQSVWPVFNSLRYGRPEYCQLADWCCDEIRRGADDQSEMGVFHDLFQPQREANLRTRLAEYTPIDTNVAIVYAT